MRNDFPSQIDARWSLCQCRCRSSNEALLSSVWVPMFASLQILIFSEQIRWQSLWQQNDWMCGLFSGISSFFHHCLFVCLSCHVILYSISFLKALAKPRYHYGGLSCYSCRAFFRFPIINTSKIITRQAYLISFVKMSESNHNMWESKSDLI